MTKILIDEAALKLALEALTDRGQRHSNDYKELKNEAITALRQALANAALDKMAENARELGLDYIEFSAEQYEKELEQPAQEPVAWADIDEKGAVYGLRYWSEKDNRHEVALYTTPPAGAQLPPNCGTGYCSCIECLKGQP